MAALLSVPVYYGYVDTEKMCQRWMGNLEIHFMDNIIFNFIAQCLNRFYLDSDRLEIWDPFPKKSNFYTKFQTFDISDKLTNKLLHYLEAAEQKQ